MPYQTLRAELDQLAHQIWDDVTLVRAAQGAFRLGEVTVTERLHLSLLQSGLLTGMVRYVVPDETRTGADWEWLVRSVPASNLFFRYRIQAKILQAIPASKPGALLFSGINHRPAASITNPNPPTQRSTLLAQSAADHAVPMYAFYIGDPWPATAPIKTPQWAARAGVPRVHFGCTVVDAHAVDAIYNQAKTMNITPKDANQYLDPPTSTIGRPAGGWRLSDLFPGAPPSNGPKPQPWGPRVMGPRGGGGAGVGGPNSDGDNARTSPPSDSSHAALQYEPVRLTAHESALLERLTDRREQGSAGSVIMEEPPPEDPTLAGKMFFGV